MYTSTCTCIHVLIYNNMYMYTITCTCIDIPSCIDVYMYIHVKCSFHIITCDNY